MANPRFSRFFFISATILVALIAGASSANANAQGGSCNGDMVTPEEVRLEDVRLDVKLESDHFDGEKPLNYKVSFLKIGSHRELQQHVDYNFIINDSANNEVFNAAAAAGQKNGTLHTAEGVVTIPNSFNVGGVGTAIVEIHGIYFVPVRQVATFPCFPIPEFPVGISGVFAVILGILVAITIRKRFTP